VRCILCDSGLRHIKTLPADKYQKLIQHTGNRTWKRCTNCGLYTQHHNLSDTNLKHIYESYRNREIRIEKVKDTFKKITSLPPSQSENMYRWSWFASQVDSNNYDTVLDIGSGLGVWPYLLTKAGYIVTCVEPNRDSAKFINDELKIPCTCAFFNPRQYGTFDIVTIIHVLEHMRDPVKFLRDIKRYNLSTTGLLFIEVPDDCEIDDLNWDHDEYNSCHHFMFNLTTLSTLVEKIGLSIKSNHIKHHKLRNLTRLMVLCDHS